MMLRGYVHESIGESLDSAVLDGAAVPALFGPPLRNVLEVIGNRIVSGTDNGADGLVVGNTASAVGAVGEEVGVEHKGAQADDQGEGEGEEVNERVVGLGEGGVGGVLAAHDVNVELLAGSGSNKFHVLLEHTG